MSNYNKDGILIRTLKVLEKNRLSLIDPTMQSPLEIETADILVELKAYIDGVPKGLDRYEHKTAGYQIQIAEEAAKHLADGVKHSN